MQEDKISISAHFITLTYDYENIPISKHGFKNLYKRDVQLFIKRLRRSHGTSHISIKYYAVGEYGSKTMRPHYHIILFNSQIELIQDAWKNSKTKKYIGDIFYGSVTGASVGYCLKYMSKVSKIPMHKNDDRQKEFALMSKGIGVSYLTKNMVNWHKKDIENRMYCNLLDGRKIAMPRYYKLKLYNEEERNIAGEATLIRLRTDLQKRIDENINYHRERNQALLASFRNFNKRAIYETSYL